MDNPGNGAEEADVTPLKDLLGNKEAPVWSLVVDLNNYLKKHPKESQRSLAKKLDMSNNRPWLSQVIGLDEFGENVVKGLKIGDLSSYWLYNFYKKQPKQAETTKTKTETNVETTETGTKTTETSTETTKTNPRNNDLNAETTPRKRRFPGISPVQTGSPAKGYPLTRDTINHLEELAFFWRRAAKPQLGNLTERWLLYWRGIGWLKVGLVSFLLFFTCCGAYQTTSYIYSHWGDFWYRFKIAAFHSSGGQGLQGGSAPHITYHEFKASHHLELKWTPVVGALKYRVFWHTPDGKSITPIDKDVDTLGAVVDVYSWRKEGYVSVAGISADNAESPHSDKIPFIVSAENNIDEVEVLPPSETGGAALTANAGGAQNSGTQPGGGNPKTSFPHASGGNPQKSITTGSPTTTSGMTTGGTANQTSSPLVSGNDATQLAQSFVPQTPGITQRVGNALAAIAGRTVASATTPAAGHSVPANSYPGPTGLTSKRNANGSLALSWQDFGAGYHYNLYASYANDQPKFDRDGYLLRQASTPWYPPKTGLQVYLFYVTAVNPEGKESSPSQRLLVDMR